MARYLSEKDDIPFEDQIKTLGNDELLDFWEETQELARLMEQKEVPENIEYNPEFERLIIQELQVRSSRRELK